ncbi:MAG: stalk domain-containing protein [Lachnospiraceae bacterium]|nr:stalk domain-containing protein [Lachnospiraceae bacterium]
MKNFKSVAMGFVAGALCMVSVTAFAAYSDVTAKLFSDVTFKFDGEAKASPSDQPVLNYNGYAYVPIRFVSDNLGATIDYDIATRIIDIQSDKKIYVKEVPVEKIVYVEKDSPEGAKLNTYESLPLKSKKNKHTVEVTGVSRNPVEKTTKIFVDLDNDNEASIQLIPSKATLVVDGEPVDASMFVDKWDNGWSTGDMEYDSSREGYLLFDLLEEEWKNADLTITLRTTGSTEEEVHTFHFKRT